VRSNLITFLGAFLAVTSLACNLPSHVLADIEPHSIPHQARFDGEISDMEKLSDEDQLATPGFAAPGASATISAPGDTSPLDAAAVFTPTSPPPIFTPHLNANCRSAPDASHSLISLAMKGQGYAIVGRDLADAWYLLRVSSSADCWVFSDTGSVSGDASGVRVIYAEPTPDSAPASQPLNCSGFTTLESCALHPECTWKPNLNRDRCQPK
jgi:hypothetical protein